jgi:hypothetical protein
MAKRRNRILITSLLSLWASGLGLTLPPFEPLALAWTPSGHMQIALLAFAALPPSVQREATRLLQQHPRFQADFLPQIPPNLQTDAERERFLFAFAATWPDVVRGQPEFDHPTWHYVNLPLSLRPSGLVSCREARAEFRASHDASGSILEALPKARRTLADRSAGEGERALALSWLLHLVADSHQPLHGVALFSAERFPKGDRGGNDILFARHGTVHAVWDGLLGDDTTFRPLEREVARLRTNRSLADVAARAKLAFDPDSWIDEDCELARVSVYAPAITEAVRAFEQQKRSGKPEVELNPTYTIAATAAAMRRAVMAGARLAAALRQALSTPVKSKARP